MDTSGDLTHDEALQYALGYAHGRESASNTPTAQPGTRPGYAAFADAWAATWDAYHAGQREHAAGIRLAYDTWQESNGATIFFFDWLYRDQDSTHDQETRS